MPRRPLLFTLALSPLLAAQRTEPGTFPKTEEAAYAKSYEEAVAAKKWDAAVIALYGRIRSATSTGDEREGDFLRALDKAAEASPEPMRPALRALVAHAYAAYHDSHRWELRSRTAGGSGDKIEGWDAARLIRETDTRFHAALADEKTLLATPIASYAAITDKGESNPGDTDRPTLFDFLACDAFDYYTRADRFETQAGDSPLASRGSPLFADTGTFLDWRPAGDEAVARAANLLQRLMHAHKGDAGPFAATDLLRLKWARRLAVADETKARIRTLLGELAAGAPDTLSAPDALAELAEMLRENDEAVAAHATAKKGAALSPGSPGATRCANLAREIEAPSLTLVNERVWSTPAPRVSVRYKNLRTVHFRLVKWDWSQFLSREHGRPESLSPNERNAVIAAAPAKRWTVELEPTKNFEETELRTPAPQDLPPGFYFLLASPDADFSGKTAPVFCTDLWVSNLAVVAEGAPGEVRGRVCDARTGEPVAGATVSGWVLQNNRDRTPTHDSATDADGRFSIKTPRQRGVLLLARGANGDALAAMNEIWTTPEAREPKPRNLVAFFTDRGIYRPGQSLKFKGVVLRDDPVGLKPHVLGGRRVTVALDDANGKQVGKLQCVANDYGAFDGEFVIPKDQLPGTYALHTVGSENGRAYASVEEYKRPTFEVSLGHAAADADKPGTRTVSGAAKTYTDAPVDGAKVGWRVTRRTLTPFWCYWWHPEPDREIARGETTTGPDGAFRIAFDAEKPPVDPRGAPVTYTYTVTADVTDSAGETRSETRDVAVGNVDRIATVEQGSKAGEFDITVADLDGAPAGAVAGKIVVRRLVEPRVVHRKKLEEGRFVRPYRSRVATPVATEPDESVENDADPDAGDLSNPAKWQAGDIVASPVFKTDDKGSATVAVELPPGHYRAFLETADSAGRKVEARADTRVLPSSGEKLGLRIPFVAEHIDARDYAPGDNAVIRWGSGYDTARAYVEVSRRGKTPERFWTGAGRTLEDIRIPVSESDRGGIRVSVTEIHDNRLYREEFSLPVPWNDKKLKLVRGHFTDKLKPGAKETWTIAVTGPDGKTAAGEVVATLYDASLDAYRALDWPQDFGVWPMFVGDGYYYNPASFFNVSRHFNPVLGNFDPVFEGIPDFVRRWNNELRPPAREYAMMAKMMTGRAAAPVAAAGLSAESADSAGDGVYGDAPSRAGKAEEKPSSASPADVSPRKNLNETAFFFPHAKIDDKGVATFAFTVPEALTRWRFLAFAYDKGLRSGSIEASAVTSLDLMVRPNAPRFLREGDAVDLPVKLLNRTDKPVSGRASVTFENADNHKNLDTDLGNTAAEKPFTIPAGGSISVMWRVVVPDGCGPIAYTVRAAADSGDTDGEAGLVPVLPHRVPVVESKAASIEGPGETCVHLDNLATSGTGGTLRSTQLRVDTVSRPAWYGVMALPYLMEFPHECSEQLFNRYYANALAAHIANADPKLRATFEAWKNTPALDSPLEKDADLKQLALEETPWVYEAESESRQRRNVGILFDKARLDAEKAKILAKLEERRSADGGWPWFPGGESSPWIARTIVLGTGRLRAMGVDTDPGLALRALPVLDAEVARLHAEILKHYKTPDDFRLGSDLAHTLHARSYFLKDAPIPDNAKDAYAFFVKHAKSDWSKLDRASQGRLALALPAFDDTGTPALIVKSLRERSIATGDRGMRWNDAPDAGFAWWRPWVAPVETQALMVEVFETVAKDPKAADACRLALLADKRTNAWPTTTATADACYALLMRGDADMLSGEGACTVSIGGKTLLPEKIEAGTGAATVRLPVSEITPKAADITVKKPEAGPAWVSVHWSYLEDPAKVKPANQGALSVVKTLWKKTNTAKGPRLEAITAASPVHVGDEVVVRLEVTNDRDLEFVHIKDTRPACLEPGVVLSGYKSGSDLSYYEAVRDTATHRFVERMPKGTHVFEFSARADRRGVCGAGLSEVRCMYAPEFAAHAGAAAMTVE